MASLLCSTATCRKTSSLLPFFEVNLWRFVEILLFRNKDQRQCNPVASFVTCLCRKTSRHVWSESSSLHETRIVNLALVQCGVIPANKSGLDQTDDFQKFCRSVLDRIQFFADQDWTRTEKFHSPSISGTEHQRWSDSGFLLSNRILFLKNNVRIRSESCFG